MSMRLLTVRGWIVTAIAAVCLLASAVVGLLISSGNAFAQAGPTTWKVYAGYAATESGAPPTNQQEFVVFSNDFQPRPLEIRVGDTIEFHSTGFHTIVLGRERMDPFDTSTGFPIEDVVFPSGGNTYEGSGVVNSGLLDGVFVHPVTFTQPGEYRVLCDVHAQALPGVGMSMQVRVKGANDPVAMTPEQGNAAAMQHFLTDWTNRALPLMARASTVKVAAMPGGGWAYEVAAGFGDGHVEGVRYFPQSLVVKAGEWVKWVNPDPEVPHTVTLFPGGGLPSPDEPPPPDFNPFASSGGNVYSGDNFVNLTASQNPRYRAAGETESGMIQFTMPGTYSFLCIFHAGQNMSGSITVLP